MRKIRSILSFALIACGVMVFLSLAYISQQMETGRMGDQICLVTGISPVRENVETMLDVLEAQKTEATQETNVYDEYMFLLRVYQYKVAIQAASACLVALGSVLALRLRAQGKKRARLDTKHVTLCGMLLAIMLIMGWIEKQVTPGSHVKLGLSNSVLIFAVCMLDVPTAYILMVFKVILSSVLFGSFGSTFIIAFSGGFLSLTLMVLISRIKGMHPVTISCVGGAFHNIGQTVMAVLLVPGNQPLLRTLPGLILIGMGFGVLTGICADRVMKHLKHMRF